ncbi:MAG: alpha/beta hydrolase [Lachnospiraceae bacterium]|nr:alpha/beta hydrolase [Lachnospiraceae bacterium]
MQYITSNDGTKIAVYNYNPHDSTQEKQTILLIHGWPLSHLIFEYQINLLTNCGYRVVAVDLRGFGRSDTPACGYTYTQMAADIYQVVRQLCIKRFILVGFSMGGAIALKYMNCYNGFGVCKLILLSAAAPCFTKRPGFPYGKTVQEVNNLISLAETDRPQLCQNFSQQLFACPHSDAVVDWFRSIALSASGIGTIKCGIALRDEDVRDAFNCVHVPTYIIHGEKDLIVSNELAEIQHKCICGSKLITLSDSGHGIVYDQLDKFNSIFMDCIAE